MRLIRSATLFGAGYLLGARAGTDRYDQIVATARRVAARPELQPYLESLSNHLPPPSSAAPPDAGDTARVTETVSSATDLPVEAVPVEPVLVEAAPVEAVPVEPVPVEAVPVGSVPVASVPVEAVPVEAVRVQVSRTGRGSKRPRFPKRSGA